MLQVVSRVAAGVMRHEGRILLVSQQGPHDPHVTWSIPGGMVEDGELLSAALVREIKEETGLDVVELVPRP